MSQGRALGFGGSLGEEDDETDLEIDEGETWWRERETTGSRLERRCDIDNGHAYYAMLVEGLKMAQHSHGVAEILVSKKKTKNYTMSWSQRKEKKLRIESRE